MWGRELGSFLPYIREEQAKAAAANAPLDAIFEKTAPGGVRTGIWRTIRDLADGHPFHAKYQQALKEKR
jgi:hypothetical protein